jgi:TolB-like protein/Tfp pilus assembly protein PilF
MAQQLGDPPELLTIMYGQWRSYLIGGENNTALELGEEFLTLARTKAPAAMIRAHQIMASVLKYRGEFTSACAHTKELLAIWNPQPNDGEAVVHAAENPAMIGLFIGAWSLWNLGYPEQALQQSREALALARQDASPYGLALATFMAAELNISRREHQRVREMAEDCLAICTEHGFPQWLANGYICRGWALVEAGQGAAGVAQMREGITAMHAIEADLQRSRYLALLGEACGATGQIAEGLSLLAEALAFAEQSGERFFEAEIYRLRGELLLKSEAPQAGAEECFHQAIQVAQRQQAKSPELRAMMSLARLWQRQGKTAVAQQMLAKIYGWFTEGFDTPDLKDAKALLDELQQQVRVSSPTVREGVSLQTNALADAQATVTTSRTPSIAVLPFVNISNDAENEYFCDGLAEELLNALAKIEALRVAARTSAFSFKGKETDVREIGQRLNVSTVLEGSVRKAANRLRITAQLINVADGYHLWSERYDRELEDIFDVQDEITLTVVAALKVKLLGEEKAVVLKRYTDDTEAYQLYLKGRYHANRFTREGFNRAIENLNKAIEKDPHYALAYAGIADAYYHAATIHMPPGAAFLEVKAAATKALELDDALAEAHTLMAMFVAHYDRKPLAAESGFRRGIELAPKNVLTHQQYGLYLTLMGRFDEALTELKLAQDLDPLSLVIGFLLGWTYYFARQPEKAKQEARKTLEIEENFWMANWTLALGHEQTGQYREALAELEKAKTLDDSSWIPAVLARIYGRLGKKDEAQKILDELTEKSKQQWVAPYLVATVYVSLDQWDQAFEWLEKAFEDYDEWIDCINIDPALDGVRSDPRYQDLLRRIGLPQ